jgi:hypothetical protein
MEMMTDLMNRYFFSNFDLYFDKERENSIIWFFIHYSYSLVTTTCTWKNQSIHQNVHCKRPGTVFIHRGPSLVESCHQKCISTKYLDGVMNKGESVCVDRCVFKYMDVFQRVGTKLNAIGLQNQQQQQQQ